MIDGTDSVCCNGLDQQIYAKDTQNGSSIGLKSEIQAETEYIQSNVPNNQRAQH
jgi:hypothetical protein